MLDFGLAKVAQSSNHRAAKATETLATRAGPFRHARVYESRAGARLVNRNRTDIWSFGCVLYEMLTGRVAFPGQTARMSLQPSSSASPTGPRCRPPRRQLCASCCGVVSRKIRSNGFAILVTRGSNLETTSNPLVSSLSTRARRRVILIAAGAATVVVALTAAVMKLVRTDDHSAHPVLRLAIPLAESDVINTFTPLAAVSRDGKRIVYGANRRLYLCSRATPGGANPSGTEPPAVLGAGRNLGFRRQPVLLARRAVGWLHASRRTQESAGDGWCRDNRIESCGSPRRRIGTLWPHYVERGQRYPLCLKRPRRHPWQRHMAGGSGGRLSPSYSIPLRQGRLLPPHNYCPEEARSCLPFQQALTGTMQLSSFNRSAQVSATSSCVGPSVVGTS